MSIIAAPGTSLARDLHVGDRVVLAPGARPVEITEAHPDDALTMLSYADDYGHPGACQRGACEAVQLADDDLARRA